MKVIFIWKTVKGGVSRTCHHSSSYIFVVAADISAQLQQKNQTREEKGKHKEGEGSKGRRKKEWKRSSVRLFSSELSSKKEENIPPNWGRGYKLES